MKYSLCHSCMYYQDDIKTPFLRQPKHCECPYLEPYFGIQSGGFINGIDIFHCCFHRQYAAECGDCFIDFGNFGCLSYVIPAERKMRNLFHLSDNSLNIKDVTFKRTRSKTRSKTRIEEPIASSSSDNFGIDYCPF